MSVNQSECRPGDEPLPMPNRMPLWVKVLIGVVLGAGLGVVFGNRPYLFGMGNADLGELGLLVIRLLKAMAIPLILFAILDAFVRTRITGRQGARLILICLCNVSVAFLIGLTLMNTIRPGTHWRGQLEQIAAKEKAAAASTIAAPAKPPAEVSLNPIKNISGYIPESLLDPLIKNNVISLVLLAILVGAALRRVKERGDPEHPELEEGFRTLENLISAGYQVMLQLLEWVVQAIPWAVFGILASVVGKYGLEIFQVLWIFLATLLLGLGIHSLGYYPLVAWLYGRKPPAVYLGRGADAIVTGLSTNSSLATVPITLRCLNKMGVSEPSARLAACIGTNLNNDGITLYEAMAALFLTQALGYDLSLGKQVVIVLAALMAGIGVAWIPEAGLVVLPLVLSAAGLPEDIVALAIPLIVPVDWIIARCRSGVNVMSDMLVAIMLDRHETDDSAPVV